MDAYLSTGATGQVKRAIDGEEDQHSKRHCGGNNDKPETEITPQAPGATPSASNMPPNANSVPVLTVADEQMDRLFDRLSSRLTTLTTGMEERLRVSITTAMKDIMKVEIDRSMDTLRQEFKEETKSLGEKMDKKMASIEQNAATYAEAVKAEPNEEVIVVKNLIYAEAEKENVQITQNKVESLLKDGLGISDARIKSVERFKTKSKRPGIVVVKCMDKRERDRILEKKTSLKDKEQFKKVWLEAWSPVEQRAIEASFHTMLKVMGKEKEYVVRGKSIFKRKAPMEGQQPAQLPR